MFVDKVNIHIKAGNGGDGALSFLRNKKTMNGGPDGGDGGKGGDVVFVVDKNSNNLVDFYYQKHYRAENGANGGKHHCAGKAGEDMIVKVPRGTIIREKDTNRVIADMFYPDDKCVVLRGGLGGRGNQNFATSTRQAPAFAETGVKTKEFEVVLELKTIADVGLLGFPSVGKSKILSVLTSAKPKIADYHFTTLSPNLGVASYGGRTFLMADIPGLIEGASEGKGLGFQFLKHVERTKILLHVVDIAEVDGRSAIEDFKVINTELEKYSKNLVGVPQIVLLNKIDLLNGDMTKVEEFKKEYGKDYKILTYSAATREGENELLQTIVEYLSKLPESKPEQVEVFQIDKRDLTKFEIIKEGNTYELVGDKIDEIIRGVNLDEPESFAYFQNRLKDEGVMKKLIQSGLKDGDYIRVKTFEFEYWE